LTGPLRYVSARLEHYSYEASASLKRPTGQTHWEAIIGDLTLNDKSQQLASGGPSRWTIANKKEQKIKKTTSTNEAKKTRHRILRHVRVDWLPHPWRKADLGGTDTA